MIGNYAGLNGLDCACQNPVSRAQGFADYIRATSAPSGLQGLGYMGAVSPWVSNGNYTVTNSETGQTGTVGGNFARGERVPEHVVTADYQGSSMSSSIPGGISTGLQIAGQALPLGLAVAGMFGKQPKQQQVYMPPPPPPPAPGMSTGTMVAIGAGVVGLGLVVVLASRPAPAAKANPPRSRRRFNRRLRRGR